MSNSVYDGGAAADRKIKQYQVEHPGVTYSQAMRILMKQEDAEEREAHAEFAERVPAYEEEFGLKTYEAAQTVLAHDDALSYGYGDSDPTSLVRRQSELWKLAKDMTNGGKTTMASAVLQLLQNDHDVSRKVAGDWLSATAKVAINNLNLGSDVEKAFPVAFRLTMKTHPEVTAMYSSGAATELAVRTIFRQWFKS